MLISQLVLRRRGCGQIDMARMIKKEGKLTIELREVKSSVIGKKCARIKQMSRLYKSATFIGAVFSKPIDLKIEDFAGEE